MQSCEPFRVLRLFAVQQHAVAYSPSRTCSNLPRERSARRPAARSATAGSLICIRVLRRWPATDSTDFTEISAPARKSPQVALFVSFLRAILLFSASDRSFL
ncbi:MAG: hypothetical protein DMG08_15055 [Acidobacteria bacterium]|nr:MAG: hypothetical protein DMG08_15055 [Acidobacteriota bacterium]